LPDQVDHQVLMVYWIGTSGSSGSGLSGTSGSSGSGEFAI
jgi:hypothetical protein